MGSRGFPTNRNAWHSRALSYFFQITIPLPFLGICSYNFNLVFVYLLSHIDVFWVVKLTSVLFSQNNPCVIQSPYCRSFHVRLVVFLPSKLLIIWVKILQLLVVRACLTWWFWLLISKELEYRNTTNVSQEKHPPIESILAEKVDYSYICSKIPFSDYLEVIDPVQVSGVERLVNLPKHMPNRITVCHFIERIPSSPQAKPYKKMHWG